MILKKWNMKKIEIEDELRSEVESLCSKDIDDALRIKKLNKKDIKD